MERLTPLSAGFLQIEDADASATLAIGSVAVFEGPAPSHPEFVAFITGRLPLVPRFRQRVQQAPLDITAPVWVDDPGTDIDWHVRRTAIASPGTQRQLDDLVARVMSQRMDRRRPLWEYWVVEGLEEDRWALISKAHHCVVDGISGAGLFTLVFDESPRPRPPCPDDWEPRAGPTTSELAMQAVRDLAGAPAAAARVVRSLVSTPGDIVRLSVETGRGTLALVRSLAPAAPTSLSGPIVRPRRYETTTLSMADVQRVRAVLGGTVNDVALAAISGGFRALLLSRGEDPGPHDVRTLVPVSVRPTGEESVLDNRITMMLPYLPVDIADPVERLAEVRRRVSDAVASGEPQAASRITRVAGVEPFLPVAMAIRLAFRAPQRQLVTVTTNVPGPRRTVYAMGRRCVRITPYVPIANRMRTGIAVFSYLDDLAVGVTADYDSVEDIQVLVRGIEDSMSRLLIAADESADPVVHGGMET